MADGVGGLLRLWTESGIQILVLLSLALQVLLLIFGGMRRRGLSAWQSAVLWFVYLLADSTAIYALGHLSVTTEHRQLQAFWAPFLLLHLGGPHNITAYSLEDNRLWLRHLQVLVVQALGAAYVLYKYMVGSGTALLMLASVFMFIVGLAKYGERTWALRCASTSSTDDMCVVWLLRVPDMGDEVILLRAHTMFQMCRCLFNDRMGQTLVLGNKSDPRPFQGENMFKLVEMEVSLMYDTLYTKTPVIHTWYGLCALLVSVAGTSVALCLFHLSVSREVNNNNQGHRMAADVAISYVLLAGALVLETMAACRAVFSSWTSCLILCKAEYSHPPSRAWYWLHWLDRRVLSSLRKPFKPASRRLWRGTMGQYNLIHLAIRQRTHLWSRLAAKLGVQDSWDKLHFSGTFSGTHSLPMRRLKEMVQQKLLQDALENQHLPTPKQIPYWRGRYILTDKNGIKGVAKWTVLHKEFDESIAIWNVATDIFISESTTDAAAHDYNIELVEATRVLSNYMMFLLVAKRSMLPGRERRGLFRETSALLVTTWRHVIRKGLFPNEGQHCSLKELFHHDGPDCSSRISDHVQKKKKLIEELCREGWTPQQEEEVESDPRNLDNYENYFWCVPAVYLAKQLLHLDRPDTLELIFAVWVEMMLYAAEHAPRDSHARELSNGGEFLTIIWLLVQHYTHLREDILSDHILLDNGISSDLERSCRGCWGLFGYCLPGSSSSRTSQLSHGSNQTTPGAAAPPLHEDKEQISL
ncbi:hypothetical protein HU200_028657 [Digitaria exilis]|uniref:DUF4220 domain-containing protein n=1 Tax=Digitaria exilis TaxID=1010633 RepID=A0A835C032_9POAL|nr:hypothetical protein HU200_028657 [Digitaria exilis]